MDLPIVLSNVFGVLHINYITPRSSCVLRPWQRGLEHGCSCGTDTATWHHWHQKMCCLMCDGIACNGKGLGDDFNIFPPLADGIWKLILMIWLEIDSCSRFFGFLVCRALAVSVLRELAQSRFPRLQPANCSLQLQKEGKFRNVTEDCRPQHRSEKEIDWRHMNQM